MSDDLVSLRIIGISAAEAEFDLWRQGAGRSSVPVEFSVCNVATGIAELGAGKADICLIDDALPGAEKAAVTAAARAAEGVAALEQLRSGKFGLVFLDYNMPGFNGLETLLEIKRENPTVAVVMMTSTLDNAIADRAHAAGALAFLKKPFYPADIDRLLERYYGLHTAG